MKIKDSYYKAALSLLPITIILTLVAFFASGCTTATKVLKVTQNIEGTGTFELGGVSVIVENARQEDGRYKADKIDVVSRSVRIHATDYSRPLINDKKD